MMEEAMRNVARLLALMATFVAIPVWAQDESGVRPVEPGAPDKFVLDFNPQHPCDSGWGELTTPDEEIPEYQGGVYEYYSGYSTEARSLRQCSAAEQRGFTRVQRGPVAVQALLDHGWPQEALVDRGVLAGQAGVIFQRIHDDGEDGINGMGLNFRGRYTEPPEDPRHNDLYTDIDNNDDVMIFRGSGWELYQPGPRKGDKGDAGAAGVGQTGAGAFEAFAFGARGVLGNFGKPVGKEFPLGGGDWQSLEKGGSVFGTVSFRFHGGKGFRFGLTGELGYTFNQTNEDPQLDEGRRFSAGGTFDMVFSRDGDIVRMLWGAGSRTHGIYAFDGEYYYHRKQALLVYIGIAIAMAEKTEALRPVISLRAEGGWGNDKLPLLAAGVLAFEVEFNPVPKNSGDEDE